MRCTAIVLLVSVLVTGACRGDGTKRDPAPEPVAPPVPDPADAAEPADPPEQGDHGDHHVGIMQQPVACEELDFKESVPIAEASGAAWLTIDGSPKLVVMSDSGNNGEYAVIQPETGETLETGHLPLGSPDEDLEGFASRGDLVYAVTSPGWVRSWRREGKKFVLVDKPYPLGPIDLPGKKGGMGNRPPKTDGMVCEAEFTNCGRNYEGLCLVPTGVDMGDADDLVGFVAAKADGHLYGLHMIEGKLAVDRNIAIEVAPPGAIADCAFGEDGTLLVGGNSFDLGGVYRIENWKEPANAEIVRVASLLVGFPEVIALRGEFVYRMSDIGKAPSEMKQFHCPGIRGQ